VREVLEEIGLFRTPDSPDPVFTDTLELDLGTVVPSLAGPKRPQDRVVLSDVPTNWAKCVESFGGAKPAAKITREDGAFELENGAVCIAAITSCTNTSNPSVMIGAGLVARKARELGLTTKPWVKTSLAPGSQVVTEYLKEAGLLEDLEALRFHVVGYGCTTCIGNSGPLDDDITEAIQKNGLVVASVLSGNRNFEGRVSPLTRGNYLASPPLVVAYAIAGNMGIDLTKDPIGKSKDGKDVYLRDIWPSQKEISETIARAVKREQFQERYSVVLEGPEQWKKVQAPTGSIFAWQEDSTYIRRAPFFDGVKAGETEGFGDIVGA